MKMRGLRRKKNNQMAVIPSSSSTLSSSDSREEAPNNRARRRNQNTSKGLPQRILASPSLLLPRSNTSRSNSSSNGGSSSRTSSLVLFDPEEEEEWQSGGGTLATSSTSRSHLSLEEQGNQRLVLVTPEKQTIGMNPQAALSPVDQEDGTTDPLQASWESWVEAVGAVTPHVQHLVHCSVHLAVHAGQWAWHTAVLGPVLLPTRLVQHVVGQALHVPMLLLANHQDDYRTLPPNVASTTTAVASTAAAEVTQDEPPNNPQHQDGDDNPIVAVVRGAWELPGHVWGMAQYHVANMLLPGEEESNANEDLLERLRLDYTGDEESSLPLKGKTGRVATTNYLLRVDDLGLYYVDESQPVSERMSLHYVDLQNLEDQGEVLDRLVHVGLSLLANHPTVRLMVQPQPASYEIAWIPEGKTSRLLRRLLPLSTLDRLEVLKTETLLWSGKFCQQQGGGDRQSRFYLARGILPLSPKALLALLWDNDRTAEYNKFCLGRTTLLGEDKVDFGKDEKDDAARTTKVIQSETRVPLTSLSVKVQCLMHARVLPGTGYIIVSRSCTAGPAGNHTKTLPHLRRPPSEIQWGINLLRTVPHRPDMVDLTSLSQVTTAGVPPFLSQKIALLGVQGFFEKARQLSSDDL